MTPLTKSSNTRRETCLGLDEILLLHYQHIYLTKWEPHAVEACYQVAHTEDTM
jgi:hypothetical protein